MLSKSPMLLAVAALYGAHLLSEPVREFSRGTGIVLEGVARLLNESTSFTFESLRGVKEEVSYVYSGVAVNSFASKSGTWCVHETQLIPEFVLTGFLEAYPAAPAEASDLLRAAVSELARGSHQTRHLVKDFRSGSTSEGSAAMVVGRRNAEWQGTFCVRYQFFEIKLRWVNPVNNLFSLPNPVEPEHQKRISQNVRTSLLNTLEANFPEEVKVLQPSQELSPP